MRSELNIEIDFSMLTAAPKFEPPIVMKPGFRVVPAGGLIPEMIGFLSTTNKGKPLASFVAHLADTTSKELTCN